MSEGRALRDPNFNHKTHKRHKIDRGWTRMDADNVGQASRLSPFKTRSRHRLCRGLAETEFIGLGCLLATQVGVECAFGELIRRGELHETPF